MINSIEFYYANNPLFTYYILTLVAILGLVIGSFLNVVGLRSLSGEGIVFPPSKCPKCGTKLKWYDNIPILAYIFLLGKCRYCKNKISIQYPIVEFITSVLFVLIFVKYVFSITTLMLWVLAGACIVMCITDFREQIIFDNISIPLIPIGLVYSFFNFGGLDNKPVQIFNLDFSLPETFISALIGILVAFLFFESISLISKLLIKQRAFGEGDTIIAMIFAAWFGWQMALVSVVLGFVTQVVFTLPIIIVKLIKKQDKIALLSFFGLIFSAFLPLLINALNLNFLPTNSLIVAFAIFLLAIICASIFLKSMRESNSYTFLPFGPALITGCFIALFFWDFVSKFFML